VTVYYSDDSVTLHHGDALAVLREMPDEAANAVVTSPPYFGLRDYGEPGQYGVEATPSEYVERIVDVFAEVRRVLSDDGTLWLNLGDTYASKANAGVSVGRTRRADRAELIPNRVNTTAEAPYKSLLMLPERIVGSLINCGWILRNKIRWYKPNAMPESVTDRLSCRHEDLFLLTKSPNYWFDLDSIREPLLHPEALTKGIVFGGTNGGEGKVGASARRSGGNPSTYGAKYVEEVPGQATGSRHTRTHEQGRNPGDVWSVPTQPFSEAHFAVMPPRVAERCVLAGCRPGGVVLDPFCGSGTTGLVALRHGRRFVGVDLSAKFLDLALRTRLAQGALVDDLSIGDAR
jgi:site-specific DNA-methyltransferase (cytosine-N4-specific)